MGGRVGRPRGMTTEERFWEKVDEDADVLALDRWSCR
jgi:hypothetical protein